MAIVPKIELSLLNPEIFESKKVGQSLGYAVGDSDIDLSVTDVDETYFSGGKRTKGIAILNINGNYDGYRVLQYNSGVITVDPPLSETYSGQEILSLNLVVHAQTIPLLLTSNLVENDNNCGSLNPLAVEGGQMYSPVGPVMGDQLGAADGYVAEGSFDKIYLTNESNVYPLAGGGSSLIKKGIYLKIGDIDETIYRVIEHIEDETHPALQYVALSPRPKPIVIGDVDGGVLGYVSQYIDDETKGNTVGIETGLANGLVGMHQHNVPVHTHKVDNFNYDIAFQNLMIELVKDDMIVIQNHEYLIDSIVYDLPPAGNPPPYSGTITVAQPLQGILPDDSDISFPYVFGSVNLVLYTTQGIAYMSPSDSIGQGVHIVEINATSKTTGEFSLGSMTFNFMFASPDVQAAMVLPQGGSRTKRINVGYYYLLPDLKWELGVKGIVNHWGTQTTDSSVEFTQPKYPGIDSV